MKRHEVDTIDHTELKSVLIKYLNSLGIPADSTTVLSIDTSGNVSVESDIEVGATEPAPIQFTADGAAAPIRGQFSITSDKLKSISTGDFGPYAKYAEAIVSDSTKYGLNPLFVLADLANQGVNPKYNNPWGISTDNYPYGPGGTQLGTSNGNVKDGPRKFSDTEWRIAFDRQFEVVASATGPYGHCNTISEWALVDAPPGAGNDVHGTNSAEGVDVGELYNKLVKALG